MPKGIRASSYAGLPNLSAFWFQVDFHRQENERILEKIAFQLQNMVPKPTINVNGLKSVLKRHFKRVDDSIAFEKLIADWCTTGVYDPADHKVHRLSPYHRKKLIALGFCDKQDKNPDVKNGGRYYLVIRSDWESRTSSHGPINIGVSGNYDVLETLPNHFQNIRTGDL